MRATALAVTVFHGFGFLRGGIAAWTPSFGDGIVTFALVVGSVDGDADGLLLGRNLAEQFGEHRGIAHIADGELDRSNFQRLLVGPEMGLAPNAALNIARRTRIPLTFTPNLDAGTVDQ